MSSGFGQWYEEKKAEESGDSQRSSSWFNTDEVLPLFTTETISWSGMKESMESQMPKKIMGMGYQQRFKVRQLIAAPGMLHLVLSTIDLTLHTLMAMTCTSLLSPPFGCHRSFVASSFYPPSFLH